MYETVGNYRVTAKVRSGLMNNNTYFSQMEIKKDAEKVRKRKSTGAHEQSKVPKMDMNQSL